MQSSISTRSFLDLFARESVPAMPLDTERAAIKAAQRGDKNAMNILLSAYMPVIKRIIGEWSAKAVVRQSNETLDDVRSVAILGACEAIQEFDTDSDIEKRLSATLPTVVHRHVFDFAVDVTQVTVPARSLARYHAIMREASGDVFAAVRLAPEKAMSQETFLAIHDAVRNVTRPDAADDDLDEGSTGWDAVGAGQPKWDSGMADAEDRILVDVALAAVSPIEKEVVVMAYGFAERPLPDAEIAQLLVLSRQKVQRTRSAALVKMRDRLGAV